MRPVAMSSASESAAKSTAGSPIRPLSLGENFAWTLPANLLYAACQWGILVMLARVGSAELVGLFVVGLTLTAPVFVCASLQLRSIQATDTKNEFAFADYLGLRLLATTLAVAVAAGLGWAVGYRDAALWAVLLVTGAKALESVSDVIYGLLQQHERMDRVARSRAAHGLATLVGVGGGAVLTGDILGAAGGLLAARLLVLLACDLPAAAWIGAANVAGSLRPRLDLKRLRGLALLGLPLAGTTLLISLETNIPHYFVVHQLGVTELGVFGAIAALITAGGMFTRAMNQVASPRLAAQYHAGDCGGFRRLLGKILASYLLLGLAGIVMVPLMGRWLLGLLFGAEFAAHDDLLLVVMIAAAVAYQSGALTSAMIAIRVINRQLPLRLATAATSLLGCVLLVPRLGLLGAGLALVAAKVPFVIASAVIVWRATREPSQVPSLSVALPAGTGAGTGAGAGAQVGGREL